MTKPTGHRRPGRPYCEAFPMLDVHDVVRAVGEQRVYLEWYDEDGLLVGHVSVQDMTEDEATFSFRFYGTRNVEQGMGVLEVKLRWSKRGAYWNKPSFVCPWCGCDVTRLYFVRGTWACKKSHDLLGISQRLDHVNKAIYYKEVHEDRLKAKRKGEADDAKTAKIRNKYGRAVSLLAGEYRSELPWNLQFRSYGQWLEPGEVPTKPDMGDVGYGWTAGMAGQLPGLELPVAPADKPVTRSVRQWPSALVETAAEKAQPTLVAAEPAVPTDAPDPLSRPPSPSIRIFVSERVSPWGEAPRDREFVRIWLALP